MKISSYAPRILTLIRTAKERAGITFEELAEETGISVRTLKRIFSGEVKLSTDDAGKLLDVLNLIVLHLERPKAGTIEHKLVELVLTI